MALPATPWLNPPDYSGAFLRGAQIGASAAESRNRLQATINESAVRAQIAAQAQSQRLAQEAEMQKERLAQAQVEANLRAQTQLQIAEQRNTEQKHRIAVDAAYKNAVIGIQQQRVDEVKAKRQYEIDRAAKQFVAASQATEEAARTGDVMGAWLKHGSAAGASANAMVNAAVRSNQAKIPENIQAVPVLSPTGEEIPGMVGVPTGGPVTARNIPGYQKPGSVPAANAYWAKKYRDQLTKIEDELQRIGDPPAKTREARFKYLTGERDRLLAKVNQLVPEPGVETDEEGWQDVGGFRVRVKKK